MFMHTIQTQQNIYVYSRKCFKQQVERKIKYLMLTLFPQFFELIKRDKEVYNVMFCVTFLTRVIQQSTKTIQTHVNITKVSYL